MSSAPIEEYLKKSQVKLFKYLDTLNTVCEKMEGCQGSVKTESAMDKVEIPQESCK